MTQSGSLKHEESGLCVTLNNTRGHEKFELKPCEENRQSPYRLFDLYENGILCSKAKWGSGAQCVALPDLGNESQKHKTSISTSYNWLSENLMYSRPPSMCSKNGYCPFISLMGASSNCVGVRTYKNWCFGTKSETGNLLGPLRNCTGTPSERFKFV